MKTPPSTAQSPIATTQAGSGIASRVNSSASRRFRVSGPDYSTQGIFPLFGHYRDPHESDTWVIPGYFRMRRTNGDGVDTLFPLFWHSSFAG